MVFFTSNQNPNVFTCGYSVILLNYNCAVMSYIVYIETGGYATSSSALYTASTLSLLIGILIGQLLFGVFGDIIGRRKSFLISSGLMIFGSFLTAITGFHNTIESSTTSLFVFYRFIVGAGAGGLYPLVAAITRESSQGNIANSTLAWIFGPLGTIGVVIAPALVCTAAYMTSNININWRLTLVFGLILSVFLLVLDVEETYDQSGVIEGIEYWKSSLDSFKREIDIGFRSKKSKVFMACASVSWFLSDFIHYGNVVMQAKLIDSLWRYDKDFISVTSVASMGLVMALSLWIGGLASVYALRQISALALQLHGFVLSAGLFFLVAILRLSLPSTQWYIVLACYTMTYAAYGFGPGPTTFIIPSLLFRKSIRSSANGIAAACGKFGAIVGVLMVSALPLEIANTMSLFGAVSLAGCAITLIMMQYYFSSSGQRQQTSSNLKKVTFQYEESYHDNLEEDECEVQPII